MRLLVLALLLTACTTTRYVEAPPQKAAPRNAAIEYAHTLAADAQCMPLSTAQPKQPDTAVCDFAQVLAYCRVGIGAGSQCAAFADLRPRTGPTLEEQAKSVEANSSGNLTSDTKPEGKPAKKPKPEPKK